MKKSNKGKQKELTVNKRIEMLKTLSDLQFRMQIASSLGKTFGGNRDLYQALGYKRNPGFGDYLNLYLRQDIAKAIINAPVKACWRRAPKIVESLDEETKFEKAWEALIQKKRIWHYFSRADRIASIGSYGILFLGFDDGTDFGQELKSAKQLMYLAPYSEQNSKISQSEIDPKNERHGQPKIYSVSMKMAGTTEGTFTRNVHWTRVIHVAEDPLEDSNSGTPALEAVINRLQDLEKIVGASGEGFWQGAFQGLVFNVAPDATTQGQAWDDLRDQIELFVHGFRRDLRTQGINVEQLGPQIADPSNFVSVVLDLIATAVRIPKRILLGSERGELASSQDERAWLDRIDERRKEHCEPVIIRPFIDRLIRVGVLPEPKKDYTVDWPDLTVPGEKEIAEVGEIKSRALANYVNAIGADSILPREIFLREILRFTKEQIAQIESTFEATELEEGE